MQLRQHAVEAAYACACCLSWLLAGSLCVAAWKAYTPKWMPKSEAPAGQLDCLHGVAAFVNHLLQAHPLSTPATESSAVLDETAPTWKTPAACDWEAIQSSASKALVTALWLSSVTNRLQALQDPEYHRLCICLKQQLYSLVHRLISGHLLDPQLDMASVAGYAIGPSLTEWQPDVSSPILTLLFQCDALNDFIILLLRRMATDKALLGTSMDEDGTMGIPSCMSTATTCIDFCKFSQARAWPCHNSWCVHFIVLYVCTFASIKSSLVHYIMQSHLEHVLHDMVIYDCMPSCRFSNTPCSCAQ